MQTPISERLEIAKSAYVSGDFVRAKAFLDGVIEEAPDSPYGVGARYLRGRGYEDGVFSSEPELQKALEDFQIVKEHADEYGSDGLLGCARVLFELDAEKHADEVISYCEEAIKRDSNVKALMLLGKVYESVMRDGRTARQWYLKAYFRGLPWGMRYFARSHAKDGNVFRSVLGHSLATLSSPFLLLIHGARSPFK